MRPAAAVAALAALVPFIVLAGLATTGSSCAGAPTPLEMCRQRGDLIAALYQEKGGSAWADMAQVAAGQDAAGLIAYSEQRLFKEQCIQAGSGQPVFTVSAGAQQFFARPDVVQRCRTVVDLANSIALANASLAPQLQVACP